MMHRLSQLPVLVPDTDVPVLAKLVLLMEHMSTGPLTASLIKNLTHRDPTNFVVSVEGKLVAKQICVKLFHTKT